LSLRKKIADKYVIKFENVICGSGSESVLSCALRAFLDEEDEILSSSGTFIGFQVLAKMSGKKTHLIPQKNYTFDLNGIYKKINDSTKIIYLCNPNNPTGTAFTIDELEGFMTKVPNNILVILDEAYFEYSNGWPDYPDSMHYRWDNVLTLRSFSKVYGLAGIRIGYGMAHSDIISKLMKVKLPFEPSSLASAAGIAALDDLEFLQKSIELNRLSLKYFHFHFERLGLKYTPSIANFVMIDFNVSELAHKIHFGLLKQGIITRPLDAFGLPHCIRISTGTLEQNEKCIAALEAVLEHEHFH
jgi:histidinol-phosphate aminotransferase